MILIYAVNILWLKPFVDFILGPICRSVNETCGFQSTSPSRYHGFCCEGFVCTYFNAGGAGKCETGNVIQNSVNFSICCRAPY